MSIQVKSLGLVKNEEIEIKAIASLEVEGMRIDGIRVNESENGNLYLQFPERKFKKRSADIEVDNKKGVTVTQANPLNDQSKKTKAMVGLETNGIYLKDIRLNESNDGKLYLQFPNRKTKDDEYKDMFYPTNSELRQQLTEQAINMYQEK